MGGENAVMLERQRNEVKKERSRFDFAWASWSKNGFSGGRGSRREEAKIPCIDDEVSRGKALHRRTIQCIGCIEKLHTGLPSVSSHQKESTATPTQHTNILWLRA